MGYTIRPNAYTLQKPKLEELNAPIPKDTTELRSFNGLVNYYTKFLPDLGTTVFAGSTEDQMDMQDTRPGF